MQKRGKPTIEGAGYMKGSVHYNKKSSRYFISIYWEGDRHYIWKHPQTQEPFWHRKSAEKQLSRIQTEIDDKTFNPRHWKPSSPMLFAEYADEWLSIIDAGKTTIKDYRGYMKNHLKPFFIEKDIRNIRYSDIVLCKKTLEKKLSPKGVYNVIGCLKTMLRHAWRSEDISKVPPFPKLSYQLPEIEYLTLDQQTQMITAIPAPDRPIFEFMMEYGLRPGEARAIQKDCLMGGVLIIKRVFSNNDLREVTKTKQIRMFEMTEYSKGIIESIPAHLSPFVFVRHDGKPYTNKNLNAVWHKAEAETGLKCKLYNSVRHSLGCQLLDQGVNIDLVQDALGHTTQAMTRRYAKRHTSKITAALNKRRVVIDVKKKRPVGKQ